jgi:hypothetical protein
MKYLVGDSDVPFSQKQFIIVEADSEADAEEGYAEWSAAHEETFQDYLTDRSLDGLPGMFLIQTEEERAEVEASGELTTVSGEELKRRVNLFFSEWPDYAELFLTHYFSDDPPPETLDWPLAMKVMLWKALVVNNRWEDVTVIRFDEIPRYK